MRYSKMCYSKKANFLFDNIGWIVLGLLLLLVVLLAIPSVRESMFTSINKIFDKLRFG